ncbi:unnamed protein product [Ceutorhynchus assimilis]|uniref:Uncharacterized protein n=1 Tax=Ceutorhynchus assimilis TaxID=467358 RepID=A0A9P0DL24_9CUCU|nr:unnamed protein product [Ceutorhynchus assimilis]
MCKCCQHCLESCYWNLIEEKFCFDESIALYEEPVTKSSEKNNNMFDNMAFFDSVSVIAGRAIVTIEPLEPHRTKKPPSQPVSEQPKKRLRNWPERNSKDLQPEFLRKGKAPLIKQDNSSDTDGGTESETPQEKLLHKKTPNKLLTEKFPMKKSVSFHNIPEKSSSSGDETDYKFKTQSLIVPEEDEVTLRAKSLRERRMSKSLSLKIGDIIPKELPIIRQNSMPKFYLDTPDENQIRDSTLMRQATLVLKSPMVASGEFNFDLYSVVQIEKDRQIIEAKNPPAPIHRETSKLNLLKDKIMLKKSKSTVSASNLPYSNHM